MDILEKEALLALLGVLLLLPVFFRIWRNRKTRAALLGSTPSPTRIIHDSFYLLGLALIALALLRPYAGYEEIKIPSRHSDTLILFDISTSMLAKDLPPSRIEFAKRRIEDLLQYYAKERAGDRLGIVLFAGEAYLYCPLTSDYSALKLFTKTISPDLISFQGTALKEAFSAAVEAIQNSLAREPEVLLFTDGEDSAFDVNEILSIVTPLKFPINVLGIGTPQGRPIELEGGKFLHDGKGKVVISKLAEENLRALAEKSGGTYLQASLSGREVLSLVKKSVPAELLAVKDEKLRVYREFGPYLLLALLLAILALSIFGKIEMIVALFLIGLILPVKLQAQETLYDGYKYYEQGEFEKALEVFKEQFEKSPNEKLLQALASTYYKLGNFDEASKLFGEESSATQSGKRKFEAEFGLGNTHFMQKDYKKAIEHYENALAVKPKDEETEYNLELAKKLLIEEQKQKEQQKNEDQEEQQEKNEEQKENEQQNSAAGSSGGSEGNTSGSESGKSSSSSGNGDNMGEESSNEQQAEEDESSQQGSEENSSSKQSASSLTQSEADAWLDSLPEAPALLQSRKQRRAKSGQSW